MKIISIQIDELFGIFNYSIPFREDDKVLIITGPNGYGKTKVLNIIHNLFTKNFVYFHTLPFKVIIIKLENNVSIRISKHIDNEPGVTFSFYRNNKAIHHFNYSIKMELALERAIKRYVPVKQISVDKWININTNVVLTREEIFTDFADHLPDDINGEILNINSDSVNEILGSINVHLIKEQRLFTKAAISDQNYRGDREQNVMIETIQNYANELKLKISEFSQKSIIQTQELDSSYPSRLINEKNFLSKDEYEARFKSLKTKQEKLTEYGLYETKQDFLTYSKNDAKALSVYLKDLETKLNVFDTLLQKLDLFSNILNERRLTFKAIKINRDNGFFFVPTYGNNTSKLELIHLSSGEQHEVVLLYELIFNVEKNVLVLIDEPEISLHITWQKEFLNDLFKIAALQNIQVLIATHSPSIINNRWNLVHNLEFSNIS